MIPPASRAARRARHARATAAAVLVVAITLAACSAASSGRGGPGHDTAPARSTEPSSSSIAPQPRTAPVRSDAPPTRAEPPGPGSSGTGSSGCRYVPYGRSPRPVSRPPRHPVPATRLVLRLSLGGSTAVHELDIALTPRQSPCAVNSVAHLARAGFYNGTQCLRLVTRRIFVLQCGDPGGTGSGGPGYRFDDELTGTETYPVGTVALANGGPDTNGSQFFIVYRHAPISALYTVVGHVTSGLGVIRADARHGATSTYHTGDGRPLLPVHVRTAYAA